MTKGAGRGGLAPVLALDNGELVHRQPVVVGWVVEVYHPVLAAPVSVGETRYSELTPSTNIRWKERLSASRLEPSGRVSLRKATSNAEIGRSGSSAAKASRSRCSNTSSS